MSLKYFHIFFIAIASLLAFYFSYWCLESYATGEKGYLAYGVLSFTVGIGLILYGRSVFKKFKDVGFFTVLGFALLMGSDAVACSTCYGDPDHPVSKALTASVLFLLGTIALVLIGFLALIIHYNVRSRTLTKGEG